MSSYQPNDYVSGIPEMTELAVYVLSSLFPEPSTPTRSGSFQLPSPPPDTPPQSPQFAVCDEGTCTPPPRSNQFPTSCTRQTTSAPGRMPSQVAAQLAPPPLASFIGHILVRTRIPAPTLHRALILLTKLKSRYPKAYGTHASGHRLFVAAAMLVCGMDMDDAYRRSSWVEVCRGLFTGRELSRMEIEFLAFLNFSAHVKDAELLSWVQHFVLPYCLQTGATAPLAGFAGLEQTAAALAHQQPLHARAGQKVAQWSKPIGCFGVQAPPSPPASPTQGAVVTEGPRLCGGWGGEAMVRDRRMSIG